MNPTNPTSPVPPEPTSAPIPDGSALKLATAIATYAGSSSPQVVAFALILLELVQLFAKKNADYGTEGIKRHGVFGVMVRMWDKFSRLDHLLRAKADPQNESIEDSLLDTASYSIIALLLRRDRWGV